MDMGMHLGQGYLIGRPVPVPHAGRVSGNPGSWFAKVPVPRPALGTGSPEGRPTAARLLVAVLPAGALETPNQKVEQRFAQERELQSIPIVRMACRWG